jgi:hypothetical protein
MTLLPATKQSNLKLIAPIQGIYRLFNTNRVIYPIQSTQSLVAATKKAPASTGQALFCYHPIPG